MLVSIFRNEQFSFFNALDNEVGSNDRPLHSGNVFPLRNWFHFLPYPAEYTGDDRYNREEAELIERRLRIL